MKKITLLVMLCSVVMFANATVILDELFNYDVSKLTEETTWNHQAGVVSSGTGRTLQTGGLVYTNDGGTYVLSGVGKTMKTNVKTSKNTEAQAFISYRALPTDPISSGSVYLSFLYKPDGDQTQPASDIIGLATTSTVTTFKVLAARQLGDDRISNPFRIGINRSTTAAGAVYATTFFEKDLIYLIVAKYSFDTQTATLFVDPAIASADEPEADAISEGGAITSLENLMFFTSGTGVQSNFYISGVRVSTTWEEAVAAQAPAGLNNTSTSKLTIAGKIITSSEVGMFDVYNLQGARVYHVKNANIANTNLTRGLYILQFTDTNGRKLSQKISIH